MLEDTPTDAELAEHELRKAGIAFTLMRVETREAFVRALEEFRPDIILSDYNLPDFNGMAALEIVQRDHPEVPVIMVTGALPDIEAVELIHAGAKDYVLKDRLARLAPAVQRVLSSEQGVRARKAAEKALRESEAKFRALVESTSDWIWEINEHGRFTPMPVRKCMSCWVIRVEEIIGKTPFDLMPPERDRAGSRRGSSHPGGEETFPVVGERYSAQGWPGGVSGNQRCSHVRCTRCFQWVSRH